MAWMIIGSRPSSKTSTTTSNSRVEVSNPSTSCRCGLSSSRAIASLMSDTAASMSASATPCFRADSVTRTTQPYTKVPGWQGDELARDLESVHHLRRPNWHASAVASVAQNGFMPNIQIKDVPDETHAVLRQRASAAHQSLQEYLRSKLIAEASQPTIDEVLDRANGRTGGSLPLTDAARQLRFDRARH